MNNIDIQIDKYFELTARKYTSEEVMDYARAYMNKFGASLKEAAKGYELKSKFPKEPKMNWDSADVIKAMSQEGFTFIFDRGSRELVDCYRLQKHCHGDNYG